MAKTDKPNTRVFLCDCEGTMPLDGKALSKGLSDSSVTLCTNLCRVEVDRFSDAIGGDGRILVACTQEAPLFQETAALAESKSEIGYTNIRERAGWSAEADAATPKILALLADAQLEAPPSQTVSLVSEGSVLVYGDDEEALKSARQLATRVDATCVLKRANEILPPRVGDVALFRGTVTQMAGYLGAFEATITGLSASLPSARDALAFADKSEDATLTFDIVLDLTRDAPLVTGGERRDGYFKPDRGNPAAVQKALFEVTNLIGEFEKPRYVTYDDSLCVHSRNEIVGCSRCLDGCPAGAITPNGDTVTIDPHICGGCGICASVCPTGAASYALPAFEFLVTRVRTLLETYRKHGGTDPVLLVHDGDYGEEMIGILARSGRGLPANVLPLNVNEVTQLGFETMAAALAYGASEILILVGPTKKDDLEGAPADRARRRVYRRPRLRARPDHRSRGDGSGSGRSGPARAGKPEATSGRQFPRARWQALDDRPCLAPSAGECTQAGRSACPARGGTLRNRNCGRGRMHPLHVLRRRLPDRRLPRRPGQPPAQLR